jgi:hypothetical protein
MEISEFIDLVKQMRSTQKEYFKTRSKTVLGQSKALEKQVDMVISNGNIHPLKVDYSCPFNPPE